MRPLFWEVLVINVIKNVSVYRMSVYLGHSFECFYCIHLVFLLYIANMFARNLGKLQAKRKLSIIHLPKGNLLLIF